MFKYCKPASFEHIPLKHNYCEAPSIISQTLQNEGSVDFLGNDVKLFCMLLFADVCSAGQSLRPGVTGESIGRMKFVFKCLYGALTISLDHHASWE